MSTSAVFLFIVTASTHGFSEINAIPMPSLEVCNTAIEFIEKEIVYKRDTSLFSDDKKRSINAPVLMKCKNLEDKK